jgi:hypothetical protein
LANCGGKFVAYWPNSLQNLKWSDEAGS